MSKKIKIQIKHRFSGRILFEYEKEDNTIRDTLVEAVRRGADLCGADLCDANLCDANLCDANLCGADLCGADLCGADLCDANLCDANLCDANLCGADLRDADLRGADLRDADLRDANLRDANLCGADLRDADLRGAIVQYSDCPDGYQGVDDIIERFGNMGVEITENYQTHDHPSSKWGPIWKNILRIKSWELVSETAGSKDSGQEVPQLDRDSLPDGWVSFTTKIGRVAIRAKNIVSVEAIEGSEVLICVHEGVIVKHAVTESYLRVIDKIASALEETE